MKLKVLACVIMVDKAITVGNKYYSTLDNLWFVRRPRGRQFSGEEISIRY
jgi:hypothetical protein